VDVLSGLFPDGVVTVTGHPEEPAKPLFPEEEALVARAVEKRRREFAKGRECARSAMGHLGFHDVLLLAGKDREPLWPREITGSITHTHGLCAAAVAPSERYDGIGIDAEPAEPLETNVIERVCRLDDRGSWSRVTALDRSVVPRLVFSVKEAVYKCQFPVTRTFLGFEDVSVELGNGAFRAWLRIDAGPLPAGTEFVGGWLSRGSFLVAGAWRTRELRRAEKGR
jgi:4'-phosphopantetheinyl transferase EntD